MPVPWKKSKNIPRGSIQQLFVAKRNIERKNQTDQTYYILRIIDKANNLIEAPGRFESQDDAIYVERSIEKALKLEDVRIAGEVG